MTKPAKLPYGFKVACQYANAKPNERNWRAVVLRPFRKLILQPGGQPPDGPVFGVSSLAELEMILGPFRTVIRQLIALKDRQSAEAIAVCETIARKAGLQIDRLMFNPRTKLLVPVWRTKEERFIEMVYAHLALALQEMPARHIHECARCGKIFLDPSRRHLSFCSTVCRNRELVRRYRERNPERYRAYQRRLMRRRYAARGK